MILTITRANVAYGIMHGKVQVTDAQYDPKELWEGTLCQKAANMAAVTAGRSSRRKSRRAVSACAFLSNISLDGNINKEGMGFSNEGITVNKELENVTQKPGLESPRQTFLHSISEPNGSGGAKKVVSRQRSVTGVAIEVSKVIRRSVSMSESTDSSSTAATYTSPMNRGKHRISCFMGSSFHLKRRANDKRYGINSILLL